MELKRGDEKKNSMTRYMNEKGSYQRAAIVIASTTHILSHKMGFCLFNTVKERLLTLTNHTIRENSGSLWNTRKNFQ